MGLPRFTALSLAAALAACGGSNKNVAEPELKGGESPYAFHRAIGLTLLRTDQPRRALPHLQRMARLKPDRPEPLYYLGRAYMGMKLWGQATAVLEKAIAGAPGYAPARASLGVLRDINGHHAAAELAHQAAIKLDPDNASYHNNLGFSRYLQGRNREALAELEIALRLDPSMRRIHNNLGFVYGKLGRLDRAREHFRLAGTDAQVENNMGLIHEQRGDYERAYQAFVTALLRDPEMGAARGNLERVCRRLGKPMPDLAMRGESHEAKPN